MAHPEACCASRGDLRVEGVAACPACWLPPDAHRVVVCNHTQRDLEKLELVQHGICSVCHEPCSMHYQSGVLSGCDYPMTTLLTLTGLRIGNFLPAQISLITDLCGQYFR